MDRVIGWSGGRPAGRRAVEPEDRALVIGERRERLRPDRADRLPPDAARLDEAGRPQLPEVPRDERLGEPDVLDQLGYRRLGAREPLDDPEPVDVGQRLVDEAQLAQLVGLVDDRRQRRADSGGGGGQGQAPGERASRRINGSLYQSLLMLTEPVKRAGLPVSRAGFPDGPGPTRARPTPIPERACRLGPWSAARPPPFSWPSWERVSSWPVWS
jgi:hypothetical protein